jgi:hypothetical protein
MLLLAYLAFEAHLSKLALEDHYYFPTFLPPALRWARSAGFWGRGHLSNIVGAYLTALGIFCAVCEIVAVQRNKDYAAFTLEGWKTSVERAGLILPATALALFIGLKLAGPPRGARQGFIIDYMRDHPGRLTEQFWPGYWRTMLHYEWLHVWPVVIFGGSIAVVLAIAVIGWSVGAWGALSALVLGSKAISDRLGLKTFTPIMSIILSALGVFISLA